MSLYDVADRLELEDLYWRINREMVSVWKKNSELGLSGSQAYILIKLEKEGRQRVSDLAGTLGITLGGVTGLSDKLIAMDLAFRSRDQEDRRVVYLEITEKGKEALQAIYRKRRHFFHIFFEGLPEEDVQHLIRIYKQVLQNINSFQGE